MNEKKEAPNTRNEETGAQVMEQETRKSQSKGNVYLTPCQRLVLDLFKNNNHLSVVDITNKLHLPDPRSSIRHLRKAGIKISDYWEKAEYGRRYKRYFIKKEIGDE